MHTEQKESICVQNKNSYLDSFVGILIAQSILIE